MNCGDAKNQTHFFHRKTNSEPISKSVLKKKSVDSQKVIDLFRSFQCVNKGANIELWKLLKSIATLRCEIPGLNALLQHTLWSAVSVDNGHSVKSIFGRSSFPPCSAVLVGAVSVLSSLLVQYGNGWWWHIPANGNSRIKWLTGGLTNVVDQGAKTSHWWRRPKTFVVVPTPPVATRWRENHLHKIRLMQQIWTNIEGYGIRMDGGIGACMYIVVQLKRGDILCI